MHSRFSIVLLLFVCLPAFAQVDRASLNGTVTDATGSAVPGAKVEAVSAATGLRRQTLSGAAGTYEIAGLPIGGYTVTVTKEGFKPLKVNEVNLAVAEPRTVDARLAVGLVTEAVEVAATTEALNRTSAEVGGLVEPEQIKDIPISGRNWASLMLLVPGAINYGDGAQRAIQFNGHSLDDSNFVFDGIDTSGVQEQTQKADARLNIALDSIAEFRVSTAVYTAESGAAGGAQVSVVSKSGTNDYHGSAFYALRNDHLDARSPFDPSTLPPFTLHQFGASFGGALIKNKAFFYFNYEGLRQSLGETFINFVPNAAFRAQVLAKSPVLAPIVNAYPMGTVPIDSVTDQVTDVATDTVREDSGMFRFDYRFDDKNSAYFRYNIDNAYIDNPTDALGDHNVIPHVPTNVVVQFQHIFSPTTLNEAKFGLNRANYHNWGYGTSPVSLSVSPFDGVNSTSLDTEVGTTFNYIDNLTMVRGRHTLKAGVEVRRIRLNNSGNTLTTQSIDYASAADLINNAADSASYLQGEGVVGNRRSFYMGYLQDEFKVNPELTLNVGLRYEFYSVAHEILDRSAVVDILGCGGFCPKGTPYYDANPYDFGPRIGAAWAPRALHGKTTVRSGFGRYFGGNQNDDFSDPAESAVPRYSWSSSDTPTLSYPLTPFLNPALALYSPKAIDRHRQDLSYNNYDFVVQQDVGHGFVAQVGYVGSEGHHLFDKYTVNLINPVTGKRPLAAFGSFGLKANDGNNVFNAMQASIQRRFAHGFMLQANYMWSHSIADASTGSGTSVTFQNMSCRACDRSNSPNDVRHNLIANGVWELPFGQGKQFLSNGIAARVLGGWSLSGLAQARTGTPVNITITRKAAALPDGNTSSQRPNYVAGQPVYAAMRNIPTVWFNPAAFSIPANGTWGNLGRNIAYGPGDWEIDTGLQKRFRLTERVGLNFRASAFNLFNHPQWGNPSGNLSSASFGRITSVLNTGATGSGAPRRIEFMFRAEF
ncbi:MAG TPA: carboxypeptidase regulatory-like domain-containing protein [Bryobacteraceae bacterium]|nr:carboxypeptidase regulatory-like domain-containing protein [Bryobacteraceae bacterium]